MLDFVSLIFSTYPPRMQFVSEHNLLTQCVKRKMCTAWQQFGTYNDNNAGTQR